MGEDGHPDRQGKTGKGVSDHCLKTHGFLFSSPRVDREDEEGDMSHPPKVPPPTGADEVFLPITSESEDQLPCGKCLEADSGTIPLPQFCPLGAPSESVPPEEPPDSGSEWEDLEEIVDPDDGALRWVSLCPG